MSLALKKRRFGTARPAQIKHMVSVGKGNDTQRQQLTGCPIIKARRDARKWVGRKDNLTMPQLVSAILRG